MHVDAIHAELKRFVHQRFKVDPELLRTDPSFEEMQADSLTRLEILLHADDTFGSHVLDHIEDGLISGTPPQRLSELAALVPQCMVPVKQGRAAVAPSPSASDHGPH